jgi:hypothetical protein
MIAFIRSRANKGPSPYLTASQIGSRAYRFAYATLYKVPNSHCQNLSQRELVFLPLHTSASSLWSSSSRAPTCIYDRESRSPESVAFEILHREKANKVFVKRLHANARVLLVHPASTSWTLLLRCCRPYSFHPRRQPVCLISTHHMI